jgi:hypothetical protein
MTEAENPLGHADDQSYQRRVRSSKGGDPAHHRDMTFPRAPRLDPLRAALAKFDAAPKLTSEPQLPKTPPKAQGGKRAQ